LPDRKSISIIQLGNQTLNLILGDALKAESRDKALQATPNCA
jgi:hypothetical protein